MCNKYRGEGGSLGFTAIWVIESEAMKGKGHEEGNPSPSCG